jgi:16S rRNA C1402 (ribose-2'-O) methylase RsmI
LYNYRKYLGGMIEFLRQQNVINVLLVQRELTKCHESIPRFYITIYFLMPTFEKSVMGKQYLVISYNQEVDKLFS